MTILAVDDEKLMLMALEDAIREAVPEAEVLPFRKPADALAYTENEQVDVAFLDIRMRGMDGLELGKKMMEIDPRINIIFCTGYDDYISEAFRDVRCNGYISKPADAQKVWQEMQHLRVPLNTSRKKKVQVRCFGNFDVFADGEPMRFDRSKTKELLAYLVNANGAVCSNHEIIVNLWDDDENHDSDFKKLRMDLLDTLERYGCSDILYRQRGGLGVVTDRIDCDYYEWRSQNRGRYEGEYMKQYLWSHYWE